MEHVLKGNAGVGAKEGCADLGNRLLEGRTKTTEPGAEHPV